MTYILNKQQKCLKEKANLKEPTSNDYYNEDDYHGAWREYSEHIASLKSYPILPEQWEGYEDGAEVDEREFEFKSRIIAANTWKEYAIPKQKQVSQTDPIKELFVDKILAQLKEKDKRIKELEEILSELVALKDYKDKFGKDAWYNQKQPETWFKAKQSLQNK